MIWSVKEGDIISLPNDIYFYKVTDVYKDLAVLMNLLHQTYKEVKISKIKDTVKLLKRRP